MLKYNFGAAIHRVVRLDLADGVFEKNSTELRPQWRSHIELLITELQKDASILRLAYLGENETEDLVDDRLDAIEDKISDRWEERPLYRLVWDIMFAAGTEALLGQGVVSEQLVRHKGLGILG